MAKIDDLTSPRRREQAARVAVEELTGLALQERGLIALLTRHASESGSGAPRSRVEAHLRQSREHAAAFDAHVEALKANRGPGELLAGVVRSGLATLGYVGALAGQTATLPLARLRRGGHQERLLENAGVEGAALAIKLVILTAVSRAAELSGDEPTHAALAQIRDEAMGTWTELVAATPGLMTGLVEARGQA